MIRHGGDIYRNRVKLDISVNCNPLGMPGAVREAAEAAIHDCEAYPDAQCEKLRSALARSQRLPADWYVFGNGAASILYQSLQALRPKRVLLPAPGFVEYERAAAAVGADCRFFDSLSQPYQSDDQTEYQTEQTKRESSFPPLEEALGQEVDLVILCSPNNPTGRLISADGLEKLLAHIQNQKTVLLLDECFMDLSAQEKAADHSLLAIWQRLYETTASPKQLPERIILLKAFTKTYAMPGLRLGYALIPDPVLRGRILGQQPSWEVSIPAQAAGLAAVDQVNYLQQARSLIAAEREKLMAALRKFGFTVLPSDANFLLFYSPHPLYRKLLEQGILIRDCSDYRGLTEGWYRLCVSLPEQNEVVIQALKGIFKQYGERSTEEQ